MTPTIDGALRIGTATRDITPPAGLPFGGFPEVKHPVLVPRIAKGVHDPLMVRALALGNGRTTTVVVSADIVVFMWFDVERIRKAFSERTGLPEENLILCATHTHNGPDVMGLFGGDPEGPYSENMRTAVVDAAAEATQNPEPVVLSVAAVATEMAYCRRIIAPDGEFHSCLPWPASG